MNFCILKKIEIKNNINLEEILFFNIISRSIVLDVLIQQESLRFSSRFSEVVNKKHNNRNSLTVKIIQFSDKHNYVSMAGKMKRKNS